MDTAQPTPYFFLLASLLWRVVASLFSRGNDAWLSSVTRRVAFSVKFVLNTCRAGIGQTPSHSLRTSQRCESQRVLFCR